MCQTMGLRCYFRAERKCAVGGGCFAPIFLGKALFLFPSRHCSELCFPVPASRSSQERFCLLNPHKHGKNSTCK